MSRIKTDYIPSFVSSQLQGYHVVVASGESSLSIEGGDHV